MNDVSIFKSVYREGETTNFSTILVATTIGNFQKNIVSTMIGKFCDCMMQLQLRPEWNSLHQTDFDGGSV